MPLLIGNNPTLDEFVAAVQVWAGQVDGLNAAERLTQLTDGVASLPTVPTGGTLIWWDDDLPTGYLWCDGAAHSRTTHANLFARIGTRFGAGNGASTFNVPDLRQRFPLGKAASGTGSTLGSTGGAIDHEHDAGTLAGPSHTHGAGTYATPAHSHGGSTGNKSLDLDKTFDNFSQAAEDAAAIIEVVLDSGDDPHNHTISQQAAATITGSSGSGGTGSVTGSTAANNPPFIALNYIIKT